MYFKRSVLYLNQGFPVNIDMDTIELNNLKFDAPDTLSYYSESFIDFGFITMFSAAFPLGPFIEFTKNIVEIRMKLYTYLHIFRRPISQRTNGLGMWLDIWEG